MHLAPGHPEELIGAPCPASWHCRGDAPQREEELLWLLIEWRDGEPEPAHFFLVSLPGPRTKKQLIRLVMQRWGTERVYEDLKRSWAWTMMKATASPVGIPRLGALCCDAFIVAERARRHPARGRHPQREELHFAPPRLSSDDCSPGKCASRPGYWKMLGWGLLGGLMGNGTIILPGQLHSPLPAPRLAAAPLGVLAGRPYCADERFVPERHLPAGFLWVRAGAHADAPPLRPDLGASDLGLSARVHAYILGVPKRPAKPGVVIRGQPPAGRGPVPCASAQHGPSALFCRGLRLTYLARVARICGSAAAPRSSPSRMPSAS